MSLESAYFKHPHLMTTEEREEVHVVSQTPEFVRQHMLKTMATPDAEGREDFIRQRKPALGFTNEQLDKLLEYHCLAVAVQQRSLVKLIRGRMLIFFISPNNAVTLDDHIDILRNTTTLPPIPSWYNFSRVSFGPRILGLQACENRNCYHTEVCESDPFQRCGRCKCAYYCSIDCQKQDWSARHKFVCAEVVEKRDEMAKAGDILQVLRETFDSKN